MKLNQLTAFVSLAVVVSLAAPIPDSHNKDDSVRHHLTDSNTGSSSNCNHIGDVQCLQDISKEKADSKKFSMPKLSLSKGKPKPKSQSSTNTHKPVPHGTGSDLAGGTSSNSDGTAGGQAIGVDGAGPGLHINPNLPPINSGATKPAPSGGAGEAGSASSPPAHTGAVAPGNTGPVNSPPPGSGGVGPVSNPGSNGDPNHGPHMDGSHPESHPDQPSPQSPQNTGENLAGHGIGATHGNVPSTGAQSGSLPRPGQAASKAEAAKVTNAFERLASKGGRIGDFVKQSLSQMGPMELLFMFQSLQGSGLLGGGADQSGTGMDPSQGQGQAMDDTQGGPVGDPQDSVGGAQPESPGTQPDGSSEAGSGTAAGGAADETHGLVDDQVQGDQSQSQDQSQGKEPAPSSPANDQDLLGPSDNGGNQNQTQFGSSGSQGLPASMRTFVNY